MILSKSPLIPLYESGKYVHFLPFVRGDTEGFIRILIRCNMPGYMPLLHSVSHIFALILSVRLLTSP